MIAARQTGPFLILALLLINLGAWWAFSPLDHGRSAAFERQFVSEFIASNVVILFACTLLLATRWRRLEPLFGGLDRMYLWHRNAGLAGLALAIIHFALTPLDTANVKPGTPMGLVAFFGILLLVLLTLGPRLPVLRWVLSLSYGSWRITHKFIGFFFFIGFVHMMLVDPLIRTSTVPFAITCAAFATGVGSWLYALIVSRFVRPRGRYTVGAVKEAAPDVAELTLSPSGKPITFDPGQFVFLRFKLAWWLGEPHPFTVSSSPRETDLRLTIKAGGDFTRRLLDRIEPGMRAVVEGAYGLFDYRQGGDSQVWIAAGVGITPFLSWLRDLDQPLERDIHLFHTVRNADDTLFADELRALEASQPGLHFHLNISSRDGRLTPAMVEAAVGSLKDCHIYMCGPPPLTQSFTRAFRKAGVPTRNIHFELFNFR